MLRAGKAQPIDSTFSKLPITEHIRLYIVQYASDLLNLFYIKNSYVRQMIMCSASYCCHSWTINKKEEKKKRKPKRCQWNTYVIYLQFFDISRKHRNQLKSIIKNFRNAKSWILLYIICISLSVSDLQCKSYKCISERIKHHSLSKFDSFAKTYVRFSAPPSSSESPDPLWYRTRSKPVYMSLSRHNLLFIETTSIYMSLVADWVGRRWTASDSRHARA